MENYLMTTLIQNIEVHEVAIHPFTVDQEGDMFNTYDEGLEESDIDGWNVHSFGTVNGKASIIDEEDFETLEEAMEFAEELAEKYDVGIDERW